MTRRPSLTLLLTVAGIVSALLLLPLPPLRLLPWHALRDATENLGHPVVFAVLATLTLRFLRDRGPRPAWQYWGLTMAMCVTLGALTEWLQSITGRDGSWSDLLGDILGSLAALCAEIAVTRRSHGSGSRGLPWGVTALVVALLAVSPFLLTVAAYAQRTLAAPTFWRSDSYLLQQFSHFQAGKYPGLIVDEPPPDWRDYAYLIIDVVNRDSLAVKLNVRVHDKAHDQSFGDRYNGMFTLQPGNNHLRIPLEQVLTGPRRRRMQMDDIRGVAAFVVRPDSTRLLYVQQMALERAQTTRE